MAPDSSRLSRRRVLKTAGVAAVGGGATALLGGLVAAQGGAPAIVANNQGGRRFRGFVKYGNNLPSAETHTVRPLTGRQVLMRTEAAQTCYTNVDQVLIPGIPTNQAVIVGHGGVGVVEAIGPQVISTRIGDRVIVNLHAACGRCFNCLRMRSDWGGTNDRRDSYRYVRLMETGQLDMRTLAAASYPFDKAHEAYQAAADRTVVATVVTPTTSG